jgi:membrane protein involved in colicin uptake
MKNYIKNNISNALYFVLVAVFLWAAISTMTQAFKCPEMSQTELFIHIPKSFVCDWQHCN